MRVKLLACTPDPERVIAASARQCYSKFGADEAMKSLKKADVERLIRLLHSNGHLSPFEHASFTFLLDGISRACSHQLVRHRIASYSQQSQRYVKVEDNIITNTVTPPSIMKNKEAKSLFDGSMRDSYKCYGQLIALGVLKEDARFVLPNAACTKIVVTMNARELLHFFKLRCDPKAQWEIREAAFGMLKLARKKAPTVFEKSIYGESD